MTTKEMIIKVAKSEFKYYLSLEQSSKIAR